MGVRKFNPVSLVFGIQGMILTYIYIYIYIYELIS